MNIDKSMQCSTLYRYRQVGIKIHPYILIYRSMNKDADVFIIIIIVIIFVFQFYFIFLFQIKYPGFHKHKCVDTYLHTYVYLLKQNIL